MSRDGYCNCADCKEDQLKRARVARRRGGPAPERPDMGDGFWDRVGEAGRVRDEERKSRR